MKEAIYYRTSLLGVVDIGAKNRFVKLLIKSSILREAMCFFSDDL